MNRNIVVLILMLMFPMAANSQSAATVEAVQLPAWIDRGGSRLPVEPGMELRVNDKIGTGTLARLVIRLDEGSNVKLGENVSLDLEEIKPADSSDGSVFSSVISVLQGAFRFTTGLFGADDGREIQINLGTTTIGIRGTDVWGKSTRDRNFVVLIEGQIEVQNQSDSPLTMDQPLTLFDTPKSQDPLPVTTVEPNQLSAWAKETELEPGHGILTENGPYLVYLTSSQNVTYAEQAGQELRELGYPAEFYFANVNGNNWVRIGIKGFFTVDDAQYFKQRIAEDLGISGAWIVRQ